MLLIMVLALPAGAATVQGTLLYEKVPATPEGLDLNHPEVVPLAHVRVQLRTPDSAQVVAQGATDENGVYRLEAPENAGSVILFVDSVSGDSRIKVGNPDNDYRVFAVVTGAFEPAQAPSRVTIPARNNLSAPFNILGVIQRANRVMAQIDPDIPFDEFELGILWSPSNERGTYFDPENDLGWVRGARDTDSDEFDDSVILRAYGKYLLWIFSRDDSPGGEHHVKERLDPRLAWSEGWGAFFAQAVLGDPVFIDTRGPGAAEAFTLDLEQDVLEGDTPGYWSEHSVASALWDIYAEAAADNSHLGLGLQPIWRVLREYFPQQNFPYLMTLADGLIQQEVARQEGITAVLARRGIDYQYGVVPPVKEPFPRQIRSGVPVTGSVDSLTTRRTNLLGSADYYVVRLEREQQINLQLTVTGSDAPEAADLVLAIFTPDVGIIQTDSRHGVGSVERLSISLLEGTYVIGVLSFGATGREGEIRFGKAEYELTAEY
jgi:hypothetical protein